MMKRCFVMLQQLCTALYRPCQLACLRHARHRDALVFMSWQLTSRAAIHIAICHTTGDVGSLVGAVLLTLKTKIHENPSGITALHDNGFALSMADA